MQRNLKFIHKSQLLNLSRAREVWQRMARILRRDGAAPRDTGFFFKAVVQEIMLFILETWVVTPPMGNALGGFQA